MFHLIWYIIVGLIAGVIAKSIMHVHLKLLWTIVLGIIGSIVGGSVTHMFSRPREGLSSTLPALSSQLSALSLCCLSVTS
jgi:uncharacterized membrane protein YeaQ/YmgE (transglycosylase-associated protein family)